MQDAEPPPLGAPFSPAPGHNIPLAAASVANTINYSEASAGGHCRTAMLGVPAKPHAVPAVDSHQGQVQAASDTASQGEMEPAALSGCRTAAKRARTSVEAAAATEPEDVVARTKEYVRAIQEQAVPAAVAEAQGAAAECAARNLEALLKQHKQRVDSLKQAVDLREAGLPAEGVGTEPVEPPPPFEHQKRQQRRFLAEEQLQVLGSLVDKPSDSMLKLLNELLRDYTALQSTLGAAKAVSSASGSSQLQQEMADAALEAADLQLQVLEAQVAEVMRSMACTRRAVEATRLASRQTPYAPGAFSCLNAAAGLYAEGNDCRNCFARGCRGPPKVAQLLFF